MATIFDYFTYNHVMLKMQCFDKQFDLSLTPEDFDPPLKRKEPLVPGYWTVEELKDELGVSIRKVQFDITGYEKLRVRAKLKAIKVGSVFLIPELDALEYIQLQRKAKFKN